MKSPSRILYKATAHGVIRRKIKMIGKLQPKLVSKALINEVKNLKVKFVPSHKIEKNIPNLGGQVRINIELLKMRIGK